jgi:hypothetical protein
MRSLALRMLLLGMLAPPAAGNKADHDALMAAHGGKTVRVGVHNKLFIDLLVYDHTDDHGDASQLHLDPVLVVEPVGGTAHVKNVGTPAPPQ